MVKKWNDPSYYGAKTRNYFKKVDKKLNVLLDSEDNSPENVESVVKLSKIQYQNIHSVVKLNDSVDNQARFLKIEAFMAYASNEAMEDAIEKAREDGFSFK